MFPFPRHLLECSLSFFRMILVIYSGLSGLSLLGGTPLHNVIALEIVTAAHFSNGMKGDAFILLHHPIVRTHALSNSSRAGTLLGGLHHTVGRRDCA